MVASAIQQLPFHELVEAFNAWQAAPDQPRTRQLQRALKRMNAAYRLAGAHISFAAAGLPELHLGTGTFEGGPPSGRAGDLVQKHVLAVGDGDRATATLWTDGPQDGAQFLAAALELTLQSLWSRHEARTRGDQLSALDAAVRGIAEVQSVDVVLQLIVDRVRDLAEAQYAALGIVGSFGNIEQFITSGITQEQRDSIGPLPRGHGLLGLIIRENASFLIADIGMDPRRHGFPPNHPEMHSFLGAPVRSKNRTIGNLYLTNKLTAPMFSDADLRLVEMFALHAGIAIENARLHDEVQRLAVVDERQRISQDLHDSVIQSLYAISLSLEDLPEISSENPDEGAARADRAIDSIHGTIRDIRNFIFGLQPELLESADLSSGIRSIAADFQSSSLIDLQVHLEEEFPGLTSDQAAHMLAIAREGLSNIAKHSGASRATLDLRTEHGTMRLTVSDNGAGFDPEQSFSSEHHGLSNLRSRASTAGGSLTVDSTLGSGTRIVAEIPLRTSV